MIKIVESLRPDTLVYELNGFVTKDEIAAIEPDMKTIEERMGHINLVIMLNAEGESMGAILKEEQLSVKHWNKIKKIAYVGDKKWWKPVVIIDNILTKFEEKYFDVDEMEKGWKWLAE